MENDDPTPWLRHELQIVIRLLFYFWMAACLLYITR